MQFTSYLENGRLTVALTGEIDHHCAKHYIQAIAGKIEAYTPDVCILDFQEVTFVDSSGRCYHRTAEHESDRRKTDPYRNLCPTNAGIPGFRDR